MLLINQNDFMHSSISRYILHKLVYINSQSNILHIFYLFVFKHIGHLLVYGVYGKIDHIHLQTTKTKTERKIWLCNIFFYVLYG